LARATLDSIALSVNQVVSATAEDLEQRRINRGGAAAGDLLVALRRGQRRLTLEWLLTLAQRARCGEASRPGGRYYATPAEASKIVKLERAFPANMERAERTLGSLLGQKPCSERSRRPRDAGG